MRQRSYSYLIAVVRIIMMMIIVACHFMQFYNKGTYNYYNIFGIASVMMFTIISGYLYGGRDIKNPFKFVFKNCLKILLPYYLYLIPVIGLYAIFSPGYLSRTTVIQSLFLAGEISGLGHFWYIRLIILCYLFTPLLYYLTKLLNKVKFKFPVIFLLLELPIVFMVVALKLNISLSEAFYYSLYIIGYVMGFLVNTLDIKKSRLMYGFGIFGILAIPSIIIFQISFITSGKITSTLNDYSPVDFPFNYTLILMSLTMVMVVGLFAIIVCMSDKADKGDYLGMKNFIKTASDYTFPLFIVHHFFIMGPNPFNVADMIPVMGIRVALILSLITAIILKAVTDLVMSVFKKIGKKKELVKI